MNPTDETGNFSFSTCSLKTLKALLENAWVLIHTEQ